MGGSREWRLFVSQQECARKISDVFLFDLRGQLSLTASVTKCPKTQMLGQKENCKRHEMLSNYTTAAQ